MFNSIPKLIQVNKSLWEEKNSMQNNLFQDNPDKDIKVFNFEKTKDWTKNEILMSKNNGNKINFFANRFAAKEAFVKSLGIGFRKSLNFKDISIKNSKLGKPSFLISNKIKKLIKKRFKTSSFNFFLSISDEKNYSVAFVVFQK